MNIYDVSPAFAELRPFLEGAWVKAGDAREQIETDGKS